MSFLGGWTMIGRNRLKSMVALAALLGLTDLASAQTAERARPAQDARAAARHAEVNANKQPRKASFKVQAAKAYELTGDVNSSRTAANEALEREPNNVEAMQVLARLSAREENWGDAVALLRRAAQIDPNNASTQLALGQALEKVGDQSGSDAAYATYQSLRGKKPVIDSPDKL
jgi:Flp pilus assembly protein TadD